jgi:hypothetical protein
MVEGRVSRGVCRLTFINGNPLFIVGLSVYNERRSRHAAGGLPGEDRERTPVARSRLAGPVERRVPRPFLSALGGVAPRQVRARGRTRRGSPRGPLHPPHARWRPRLRVRRVPGGGPRGPPTGEAPDVVPLAMVLFECDVWERPSGASPVRSRDCSTGASTSETAAKRETTTERGRERDCVTSTMCRPSRGPPETAWAPVDRVRCSELAMKTVYPRGVGPGTLPMEGEH